ncbi:MAG: hypothetical protein E7236_02640 [Lachnospiraceae bacterium]|nr:hypothetical protein [Lachnospiraceae bacterium]
MKYEIHNDRIVMRDENGKAVAQIQYPEVGKNVNEIAHIYGENSPEGRAHANLLMEMAVAEIRKNGRMLIPGCAFATHWFTKHPEEQDVVTSWDALKEMEAALYGEPTKEISPVNSSAQAGVSGETGNIGKVGKQDEEAARLEKDKKQFEEDVRSAKERKKAQKEARKKELARQQEEERQLAILEDAKEEEEKIRKGEARLDSSLTVVLRVLQVISMLCMVAVLAFYFSAAITEKIYIVENFPQLICLGLSAFILIFGVIQIIWIMTRKRLRDEFGDKLDIRYDAGRGVFGFIVILIISLVCGFAVNYVPEGLVDLIGISQFSEIYQMRIMPIVYAAIAGLVLCIIRKAAGRTLVR